MLRQHQQKINTETPRLRLFSGEFFEPYRKRQKRALLCVVLSTTYAHCLQYVDTYFVDHVINMRIYATNTNIEQLFCCVECTTPSGIAWVYARGTIIVYLRRIVDYCVSYVYLNLCIPPLHEKLYGQRLAFLVN